MQPVAEGKNRKIIAGVIVLVAIVLVVIGTKIAQSKQHTASGTAPTSSTIAPGSSSTTQFKDGTFSATGNYDSPGGTEAIKVNLTLKSDRVTDATVTPTITTDGEARDYQQQFIHGFKAQVVGKKADAIHLSRVSGSSLTSQGFNDALSQIVSQAKS